MEKKRGTAPEKILYLIFYYLFSAVLSVSMIFMYFLGAFNLYVFVYGKIFVYLDFGFLALLWVLPVLLRKKRSRVMLGVLTVCFALYLFVPGRVFCERARNMYSNFSYEEWASYPVVREAMYEDLMNSESPAYIIGKTAEEAKTMLGEPDYEDGCYLKYNTTPTPGAIRIILNDNIVTNIDYPLD